MAELTEMAGVAEAETQAAYAWALDYDDPDEFPTQPTQRLTSRRITTLSLAASLVLIAMASVVALTVVRDTNQPEAAVPPPVPQGIQGPYTVLKVIDGDTIHVDANGQRLKIRMIGLDTPETVDPRKPVQCFGREASAQAKTILGGQSVYLETDPSQDTIDRHGRTLAYVWTSSGRLFNLDMIADGFAFEYTYDLPYRYQADFKAAEADASANDRGLWSPNTCAA